jgi:glycosyltransferase involved in cell wall biosynthesis
MRIICTVTNDLSHDQRMIRICSSLQRAGYEVCLVGRQLPDSPALRPRTFRQYRLRCWFQRGKLFYLEYQLRLGYYLYRQPAAVINAVDLDTLLPAYLISRWRGIPCVYDAHEYFTETPEVARRPLVKRVWETLADWIIPQLTYCYTVGPGLAQLLSKRYGPAFAVIRNLPQRKPILPKPTAQAGKRAQESSSVEHAGSRVILYQGMLNEGRGLEIAIAAMASLPEEFVLWLVGKGDLMAELQAQVLRLGLQERVRFWGFVPPEELPGFTEQAWLGLNLLENRSLSYYYSLANKAFDYIQAGLPAVHMDFPEYRALQKEWHCLQLLPQLNADALATLIKTLATNPTLYQQLVQGNRQAATQLHWAREEALLCDFYMRLVPLGGSGT